MLYGMRTSQDSMASLMESAETRIWTNPPPRRGRIEVGMLYKIARLIVRVPGKFRRIFVGDLQAESAWLFEVGTQLLRPSPFALTVLVALFDAGRMELINNGVEVVIGHVEGKVTAAIGGLGHFAK